MAALNKTNVDAPVAIPQTSPVSIRGVSDDEAHTPVDSPAHELQQALHNAGFGERNPRSMSNLMLVVSIVCVYGLSMLMMSSILA